MLVKDVMTENPVTVQEKDTLATVADLFYELDIRHIPVVQGNELVGIISDRDLRENQVPSKVTIQNPDSDNWENT